MSEKVLPPTVAYTRREVSYTESRSGNHEIDEIAAYPSDGGVSIYGRSHKQLIGFHIRVDEIAMRAFCRSFLEERGYRIEKLSQAALDVLAERQRQDQQWGVQDHNPIVNQAYLQRAMGELARFSLQSWADRKRYVENMRREAVEVAAEALAIVESLDRDEWEW
jgi:hypothetical protein